MKNLSTVLETLNSNTVCLPDSIVKIMLFESEVMYYCYLPFCIIYLYNTFVAF